MPRKPGRPVALLRHLFPTPESISSRLPELTLTRQAAFCAGMAFGLRCRLEKRLPQEKWLMEIGYDEWVSRFLWLVQEYGEEKASRMLAAWVATAKKPRKNTTSCDPILLLSHYALAKCALEQVKPSREWRNPTAYSLLVKEVAQAFYEKLSTDAPCTCTRRTAPPPHLERWLQKKRTLRDLMEYVLAYHHGLTPASLHRLLDKGSRMLQRSHPVKADLRPAL